MLGSAFQGTGGLPPYLTAQLVFPYQRGLAFVQRLYQAAGKRWTLVDAAHRSHPPVSTEQILHPDAYLRFEEPQRVRLDVQRELGDGWKRSVSGVLGEFTTSELLAAGGGGAARAAAGWGGDRYELWQRDGERCGRPPCPAQDALVARWRWDTPRRRARVRRCAAALGSRGTGGEGGGRGPLDRTRRRHRGGAARWRGDARAGPDSRAGGAAGGARVIVAADALQEWASALLAAAGLEADAAATVAETLVATSLRGVDSHGVARLPIYVERLRAGVLNGSPRPRVERRDGGVAVVDADAGPGQIAGLFATDLSIELAREHGIGAVSVHSSNHYGAAGIYASRAARAGMVALSTTNADPLAVPFGGARKALGTNPIAFAAPTETGIWVLDMATSRWPRTRCSTPATRAARSPRAGRSTRPAPRSPIRTSSTRSCRWAATRATAWR